MKNYNDKIIKEWNKIKDFNIFHNIEEFSKLFIANPNGSCYKKYSNYDWCKDNFFFGDYKDLLTFYQTSTEIPFYLNNNIGKKFGQLTIQSFSVRVQNNKRRYFAICRCDCGNMCEKEYSRIIEGHVSTCGKHKQEHKNDLLSNYKEIIEKYWDYDKNNDPPECVNIKSEKEYWWKDESGTFKLKPTELTKRKFGTSFHEQCIYFYLKQLFNNVKNRYRLKINDTSSEADIFIQDYNVAIEYDGVFWHKEKYQDDFEKSNRFNDNNIILIRVRENGLLPIDLKLTKTIYCNFNDVDFHTTINQIILYIKDTCNLTEEDLLKVSNFKLTETQFKEDKMKILDQYRTNYVENNITKTCLIKYWDYDKNNIIPQKVSLQDNIDIWFKCPYGFNQEINVKQLANKNKLACNNSINCLNCNSFYCPLWSKCVENNTWGNYYNYLTVFNKLCPQMKKYFYYKIFIDSSGIGDYEQYIGKCLNDNNDLLYNIEIIYQRHKTELLNNNDLLYKTKQVFDSITLSTQLFKNLEDLYDFLFYYQPKIKNINYEEFDVDETHRTFLLNIIESYKIEPHIWEDYRNKISSSFFDLIKERISKHSIELSLKIFNIEELKQIIQKHNPQISNVIFSDFNFDTECRKFLISILSKIPYFTGIFGDWGYTFMPKWKINQLNELQQKIGIKEIKLNENNINEYIKLDWKQRKNPGRFGIIFTKLNFNSFLKIDSLTIDFKEEIKKKYFNNMRINAKSIIPNIYGQQHEISIGGKRNPIFNECPFVIKNIKGNVLIL